MSTESCSSSGDFGDVLKCCVINSGQRVDDHVERY